MKHAGAGLPRRRPDHHAARSDIRDTYTSGRGGCGCARAGRSRDWRAASGSWSSPSCRPGTRRRRCWRRSSELTNPQAEGRQEGADRRADSRRSSSCCRMLDKRATSRARMHPVRLVFEPRTSKIDETNSCALLLAQTSLETNAPINLVMIGLDGRPTRQAICARSCRSGSSSASTRSRGARSTGCDKVTTASTSSKGGRSSCSTWTRSSRSSARPTSPRRT